MDGSFGVATESAVMAFQKSVNVAVDGIVGAVTWSLLLVGAEKLSGSPSIYDALEILKKLAKLPNTAPEGSDISDVLRILRVLAKLE